MEIDNEEKDEVVDIEVYIYHTLSLGYGPATSCGWNGPPCCPRLSYYR